MNPSVINRIEYAVSIKHWCEFHPTASDEDLRNFLLKIEQNVQKETEHKSVRSTFFKDYNYA